MSDSNGSKKYSVNISPGAGLSDERKEKLPEQDIQHARRIHEVLCDSCGKPTRVYTTVRGIHSHCAPCNRDIKIAMSSMMIQPVTRPRGIKKEVLVPQTGSRG